MEMPLSCPSIGARERDYVNDALASGWISGTGPYVERFETAVASKVRRAYVIAVSSGTMALELALVALGIGPGDEVIVPALTFAAPAAAVLNVGAIPVLCDISTIDWTLSPLSAAKSMTVRTRAIIAVDLLGHPCDYTALAELGLPVIEDAAQAHGAAVVDRPVGGFGVLSVFSFHANKAVTCGEGGCLTTDDVNLAQKIRLLANHGMTAARPYRHELAGRNGRMTNLSAALGLAQVERWDELISGRRRVSERYARMASELGYLGRPVRPGVTPACWLHTVFTEPAKTEHLVRLGRESRVDVRAIWPALPELPCFAEFLRQPCPVATAIAHSCVWLPTWAHMTAQEIDVVVERVLLPAVGWKV